MEIGDVIWCSGENLYAIVTAVREHRVDAVCVAAGNGGPRGTCCAASRAQLNPLGNHRFYFADQDDYWVKTLRPFSEGGGHVGIPRRGSHYSQIVRLRDRILTNSRILGLRNGVGKPTCVCGERH